MFELFTEEAIKVIMLAQEEARRLGHNFVDTEQILIGLIEQDTGIAAKTLKTMGVTLKDARVEVEKIIGRGSDVVAVEIPFTPRAKKVLELSWDEAKQLGHNYIGTEHLLLGLIREGIDTEQDNSQPTYPTETTFDAPSWFRMLNGISPESLLGKILLKLVRKREPAKEIDALGVLKNLGIDINELKINVIRLIEETKSTQASSAETEKIPSFDDLVTDLQLPPEGKELVEKLKTVIQAKETAIRNQEFDTASSLRDEEANLTERILKMSMKHGKYNENEKP